MIAIEVSKGGDEMKPPKKKATTSAKRVAAKEKTITKLRLQHDSADVKRLTGLLGKLEQSEVLLYDIWRNSQVVDAANVWLGCVHQIRQVARDLQRVVLTGEEVEL
jgi:hypothetical protein